MNTESMDSLLADMAKLLDSHNAAIVRSANSSNDLVICVQTGPREFDEVIFAEEVSESSIRNEWYIR